LKELWVW